MTLASFKIRNLTAGGAWSPSTDGGFDADPGDELELQLESSPAPAVDLTIFSCTDRSKGRSAPVFAPVSGQAATPTSAVTLTLPSTERGTWAIQCQVNGGGDGSIASIADTTTTRYVAVRTANLNLRHLLSGERTEYEAAGWAVALQELEDVLDVTGSANASGTGGTVGKFTGAGASTTVGDSTITDASGVVNTTSLVTITKSGIGTTKTAGFYSINATASGSQVSAQIGGSAKHSGGTQHNFGGQCEPQSASRAIWRQCYGTGDPAVTPPANTGTTLDTSDPNFGVALSCSTFVASSGGNGHRLASNGGGVKEDGSSNAIFQNAAAGSKWQATSSTSTGNTGPRFEFLCDAGTPTAGRAWRIGYGSGSFATELIGQSCATATMGRVYIMGIPIGWNLVTLSADATVAIGDRVLVHGGGKTITLPAVPSTVSTRDHDIIITEIDGGVLVTPITIAAASGDLINGSASTTIGVGFGSLTLCHDGDGTNWRIVSSHLL